MKDHSKGLLEPVLIYLRARKAAALIAGKTGRVLDIGSGYRAYFLCHTAINHRVAIDRCEADLVPRCVEWHRVDVNDNPSLPFADGEFSAITILAVLEHLNSFSARRLLIECCRVLEPSGKLAITTPTRLCDKLLTPLARLNLVNAELFHEHETIYDTNGLARALLLAGFDPGSIAVGHWELGLNLWATATK